MLLAALATLLVLTGCGDDGGPVIAGGDTGGGGETDTGMADTTPTDTGEADADADAGEPDTGEIDTSTDVPEEDTTVEPDIGTGDCDPACPARFICVEGECIEQCTDAADCDDANPCTRDACTRGVCEYENVDVAIADVTDGDCRRVACVEGELQDIADETDTPPADDIGCTVERCRGTSPEYYANHALCDDGDDLNGFEICSPPDGGCVLGDSPPWVCDEFFPGWELEETCGDGQDNNNNGLADEGCPCEFGSAQRCFLGAPNARDVGGCIDGFQRCINRDSPEWSECEGGILPSEEICDAKDNDCDGCVDDIPECEPLLTCPDEDFARPLRWYPLDAESIFGGEGLEFEWTVIAPANSATTGAEDPSASSTRVYLDVSGDYQISLTVSDDKGDLYGCSWVVHVAGSGLRVEMRWDTFGSVDMDMHLSRTPATAFCDRSTDCYYANCRVYGSVAWGYPASPGTECELTLGATSCPNPRLDIDNIRGFDPENINLDNPNDGDVFRVMAHKFSGSAATDPVVSIYCGGRLRAVLGEDPDGANLTSSGGGCGGNTWRVADVQMLVDDDTGATDCIVDVLTGDDGGWLIYNGNSAFGPPTSFE